MTTGPFRGRTAAWLVGVVAVSFTATILLIAFGDEFDRTPSALADTTSRSAIGHKAFVELLRSIGVPVVVSRFDSERKAGASALLVVAEPNLALGTENTLRVQEERNRALKRMLTRDGEVLLVLPKWEGHPDPDRNQWIRSADLLPIGWVNQVLDVLGKEVNVPLHAHRVPADEIAPWELDDLKPWTGPPTLGEETQWLVDAKGLEPIVWKGGNILVASVQRGGHRTYILSDPDVLSTHGLGRGDNALFAASLVELARGTREAVVFDETLHGVDAAPNVWRAMFRFPLVLVLIQALLAAVVLLWAATGRFGAPVPEAPALDAGKRFLVDNTADLMHFGGHASGALERYWKTTVQDVARATHAPPHLPNAELSQWLERAGAARGVTARMEDLAAAVANAKGEESQAIDAREIVAAAAGIHRWRREMIDGSSADS